MSSKNQNTVVDGWHFILIFLADSSINLNFTNIVTNILTNIMTDKVTKLGTTIPY